MGWQDGTPVNQPAWMQGKPVNAAPQEAPPLSAGDVATGAISNIPTSAVNVVSGIAQAVRHPLDTGRTLLDAAAGGLHNALPASVSGAIDSLDTSPESQANTNRAVDTADAVGKFLKDRYGGVENIKRTIATDPVGAAMDLSTVLSGGAGIAGKVPELAKAATVLDRAAEVTNPINAVTPVIRAAGTPVKAALGLTTGVGADTVGAAFQAGKAGDQTFLAHANGSADMTDLLTQAKQALQNMRTERGVNYQEGIASTAADTKPLDTNDITDAMKKVTDSFQFGDKSKLGDAELGKVQEMQQVVKGWLTDPDPKYRTAAGLDALKQRLDALYPDSPMQSQAQRAITATRNAVKDTVVNQVPEYSDTMKQYEESYKLEQEITKALSLGTKASASTAMGRLQSITRNNASTGNAYRAQLAKQLEDVGGVNLRSAAAGQAMNALTPRGLTGNIGASANMLVAAMTHNPALLGLLAVQSPRAVGMASYAAGRGSALAARTPAVKNALSGLYQAGRLPSRP